jgi:enediyne biosynthesis protein E3
MNTQERILSRIHIIEEAFKNVAGSPLEETFAALVVRLDSVDQEFISLGYEAASFKIAVQCIKTDPSRWVTFLEDYAAIHSVQTHVGLGWAAGKVSVPFDELATFVDKDSLRYVADGCGFFYGTLRRRMAIDEQKRCADLDGLEPFFDEGLGRSLWYSSGGNLLDVQRIIDSFDENRRAFIWRGIGIAFTYAGGFDSSTLALLKEVSGKYLEDVCLGVASVVTSRSKANTLNDYAVRATRAICNCEIAELKTLFP